MPVEFISATHTTPSTEATGSGRHFGFDVDYTRRFVRYLDDGGFDWTLVAYGSLSADSAQVAQFVVNNSERVKPMLAHRPGFVFPTLAAKSFATIDQIGQGRLGIHIISGGTDAEQRREGDYLSKSERYQRSDEFIEIIRVGGRQGDIFGLWGEPLKETAEQIAAVNAQADAAGRPHPRIWVSFRPIVAPTDELAWEKAHQVLAQTQANIAANGLGRRRPGGAPQNVGSQRLLDVAERGELHDRALWTPLVTAIGAGGSATALVGSYETVAQALLDYVDIGCELLSIRGWDPLNDAIDYARYVLPLVRQELAHRAAAAADGH
jgi:alkanesulfonate monooxygenase